MKNVAYVEPIGGATGNMLLGALVDAGADAAQIETALRTIVADGWSLETSRVVRRGIAATYLDFVIAGEDERAIAGARSAHHGTHLHDVLELVERSGLRASQKERVGRVYGLLGEAEARVHGSTIDETHFHEVGALDAILDVAGFVVACDLLGIQELHCARIPIGTGEIAMSHGRYPNPPPATAELLRGVPTFDAHVPGELVTTTAAALLKAFCTSFDERPDMTIASYGYGAGTRDSELPNVTRIGIGALSASGDRGEFVSVLEANIDDMSPQFFELAIERLFAAGALDVWLTPISMKKSRPAIAISAMVPTPLESACAHVLLRETTTIGVRTRVERRYTMDRAIRTVVTAFGEIRVKDVRLNGTRRAMPEYEDVARVARERNEPIQTIYRAVEAALEEA